MKTLLLAAGALAALSSATPSLAQRVVDEGVKVNQVILYGDEACPPSTDEVINICGKLPEEERYRIPKNLRDTDRPEHNSWANRALELQYVGRTGTDSCSTTGPGGFTGCLQQIIGHARAERQNADDIDWNALIDQARQERLGRIDAESEAVEREQRKPNPR